MDRSLIKSMMPSLVAGHVPRNVRSFKYRVFDDQPLSSTLGFAIDPQPFDGKVVAATDDAIVVKLKPSEFAVLDPSLVTTVPAEGAKVHVQPYARRRFDGLPTTGYRSKSWDEFVKPDAPVFDFIFTVCDNAAGEACPLWPGKPVSAHWGVPDPAAVEGTLERQSKAFFDSQLRSQAPWRTLKRI